MLSIEPIHSPTTGWDNIAYKEYVYKKYYPINSQFNVWIDKTTPEDLEMGTIEDHLTNILKKVCCFPSC